MLSHFAGAYFLEKNHIIALQCNFFYIENLQSPIFYDILRLHSKKNAKFVLGKKRYEVAHKEEREQATKQFNTRLPSNEYDEIVAFLKKHGIPKVDLIRIGYGTLLENYKEIK